MNKTQNTPVIKAHALPCGNIQAQGTYLARNDVLTQYRHNGCKYMHERNIQRMKSAGYEFVHVLITPHSTLALAPSAELSV
jgi:hypothetical protein